MLKEKKESTTAQLVNQQIRAERVQLIVQDGENIGVVSRGQALRQAEEAGLDLVMIAQAGKEGVPVVKIMDFGKVLYEKKKKTIEAKKHQKVIQIKEVKMSPKIGEHDYQIKIKQAVQFLTSGKRVKITLSFRGREMTSKESRGAEIFDKIQKNFESHPWAHNLVQEQDSKLGKMWSRIYYLK
ncbi:MAG TPA: translation initiation factor IF-3 [Candidatus Babeliales bacterium]|jgi:translation initiation factor IF-3|nr:translation initiation factor IF-3 [Candidatus Babeliales bacterium]